MSAARTNQNSMKAKTIYIALFTAIILCTSSCEGLLNKIQPATVAQVLGNPSKFSQEPFYITGVVADNGLSILGFKCFWLTDKNGNELRVRTHRGVLPAYGEEIKIRVRLAENFSILGASDKVLIELPDN